MHSEEDIRSELNVINAEKADDRDEGSASRKFPPIKIADPRIEKAIRYIEKTPAVKTNLSDVANYVGVSLFHFQRTFTDVMGESPTSYMRRTRLDRAAMNLQMSDEPIVQVAMNAGFSSHEAFIRSFHRQFRIVPSGFRALSRTFIPEFSDARAERAKAAQIVEMNDFALLAMRFHGPHQMFSSHWKLFLDVINKYHFSDHIEGFFSIVHDTPLVTPASFLRHDCAIRLRKLDHHCPELHPVDFRQGRYVTLLHNGDINNIIDTFATLSIEWINNRDEIFLPDGNGGYISYSRPPVADGGEKSEIYVILPLN